MPTLLLIHGPNLNQLGQRDAEAYGLVTLKTIETTMANEAGQLGYSLKTFQSNHEGALIDFLQAEAHSSVGIIINPGALTHYSYALYDALVDTHLPAIEVHLSNLALREKWRQISVTAPACIGQITGKKEAGYKEALSIMHLHLTANKV